MCCKKCAVDCGLQPAGLHSASCTRRLAPNLYLGTCSLRARLVASDSRGVCPAPCWSRPATCDSRPAPRLESWLVAGGSASGPCTLYVVTGALHLSCSVLLGLAVRRGALLAVRNHGWRFEEGGTRAPCVSRLLFVLHLAACLALHVNEIEVHNGLACYTPRSLQRRPRSTALIEILSNYIQRGRQ